MTPRWLGGRRGRAWSLLVLPVLIALALPAGAVAADGVRPPPGELPGPSDAFAHFVGDQGHVSVVEVSGDYSQLYQGEINALPRALIARELYAHHPDQYDFLVAFSTFEFDTGDAVAFHLGVRNDVQGIGLPQFDDSDLYGSAGRLQGFIDMAALRRYVTDPLAPGFEDTLAIAVHEILHQWGAYVRFRRPDGSLSDALLGRDGSHWSYLLDSDASVLYGNDWHDRGDGTFVSTGALRLLSPLDLYLAGFFSPEEVPPFLLIDNPAVDPTQLSRVGATVSGQATTVTVDDVIAAEGPRVPAASAARKDFRAAFVLLVRPGETPTSTQIAALERIRQGLETRFSVLTGGRGILEIYPEAPPGAEPGAPGELPGGPVRGTEASLVDGLAWLRAQQGVDGSWQDRPATQTRDTTLALDTLSTLDGQFIGAGGALDWIEARLASGSEITTDYLARSALALVGQGRSASDPVARLLALQNPDGGWGLGAGYASDSTDTALALGALDGAPGVPAAAVDAGAGLLLASQGPDGGWGSSAGGPGRTAITATVLQTLHRLGRESTVLPAALAFLAGKQNPDGGFGDSPSTSHDTAIALEALIATGGVGSVDGGAARAYLASHQTEEGSWEGSVYSTALALDTLKRFGYPNWRFATPLQADPAAPRDGERVSLGATVINDGNVEAPAGLVRLYDGDPDAGAAAITEAEVPPLAAGGSVVVSLTWDSLGHAGANHLVAVLDPDGATDELSELDNRASVDLDVAEAPAEADLELSDTDLNLSPAEPTELPASVAVSATVRNLGQTDVAQAVVRLLVAGPGVAPEDAIAVDEAMVAVPGRSSTPVAFTYLLEAPGTTTFVVQVDPDGAVAEADETNNQARGTVSTAAAVDLAVAPADLSLEGTPTVGSDVTFHAVFHNRGTVDSPDVPVAFTVTDGAVVRELPAATVEIAGGDAVERTVAWRVDLAGDLTFRAVIDPDGAVAETDETNNQADLAFATGGVDVPNLALAYQDLAFDPEPGREGAPVALSILVRNTGGADATGVEVGFYEGDPTQGGSLVGTLQTIPSLAAGGSATVGVTLPPLAGTGDRLIYAVADPANQIDEASEADNTAFRTLKVVSLPDLAVSPSAIESDPAFPQAGQQVTTTVTVANLGEQEADGVVVRLTVDGAPAGPDQTLPAVAPNTTGEAAFTWSYPAGATTVHLVAAVDPEDAIAEGDETNDTAERDLAAFDPTRAVSNPYVSPNGDGVQDTTVYSFTLASPADVTVEVVDSQGRTVRSHTGPELTGVVKGRFEWDGRGDDGLVVRDGTYHFRAVSSGGAVLDEALVTVDTDRWPLSAAIGTPFERVTDLTCSVEDPGSLQFVGDESEAYFLSYGGVVRVPASGPPYTLVAQSSYPGSLVVSDDGEKMAYDPEIGSDDPLAIANTDGSDRELISWANIYGLGNQAFLPGTQTLLYLGYDPYDHQVPYRLRERPLDGTGPDRSVLDYPPNNGSYITRSFSQSGLSPDGSKLVINACFRTGTTPCGLTDLQLLDVATGAYLGLPELQRDFTWSPTGKRLASVKDVDYDDLGSIPSVVIYGTDGALQHEVFLTRDLLGNLPVYDRFGPFPTDPLPYAIYTYGNSRVTWSPSGDQLAVSVEWGEVGDNYFAQYVRVYLIDATTGAIQTIGWSEPIYDFYSYHVSTWDGSQWVERTERHFGRNYSEQEVDLSQYLPDPDGEYKVRVRQTGKQAAQVDRILLRTGAPGLDGVDHRPVSARLLGPGASPEAALARVQGLDHDVLDLHENEIELRWDDPSPRATADGVKLPIRLALAAREEPDLSPRHPRPFAYPAAQGTSYQVVAGAGGAMKVDGLQTGADGLVAPLFATWSRPDTGHPAATVYGYASSDDQALYGALDFTVDNTEDGDKDWASLWVETPNGWREFRVSAVDSTWGAVGFQPTGRAAYHHKYYEFRVPLAEIGARPGDTLAVRFQAYGTAALLDPEPDLLPPEAYGLLWLPGGDTLFYYSDGSGANALIHLDQGNRVERVFDEFTTLRGAELSPSGRKLVFRDGRDIKDPQSDCYNPSFYADYSYFSFESLANDSVELKGEPTPDGRGIRLSGTATDLDFARWRLEYADEAVPEFWTPIGEAETAPVVDGDLATWLPPGPGGYLVRLTVEDLAGNRRSVVRRFSSASGSPTSITDLSESPRYISPNGDGVQDAATLHYRVLAPAHLEIGVFDEAGDRVRTFERDEGVLGTERDLVWDGRNDSGLPVPDGLYTIKVQGYAFPVTVDTVPPEALEPELRGPATLFRGVDGNDYLDVGPSVAWCASDLHPDSRGASLSIGEGADPGTWSPIAGGGVSTDCSNRGQWPSEALTLDQFVYHRFRLEARDLAGNSAVTTGPLAGEELLAYRFWDAAAGSADTGLVPVSGDVVLPQGAQARLRVAETSRSTLSRLFVQFRPACSPASGPCDPWQEDSETQLFETDTGLPATTVPEPRFDLGWDPSFLDPSTVWEIRLRSRAVDGGDLYSNVLTLRFAGGIAYHGLLQGLPSASSDPDAGPLQVALGRAGLDAQEAPVLWATEDIPDPLTDVVLFLTSEDDPRFAAGQSLPLAAVSGNVMVFDGRELLPCHTYEGAVLARVVPADGSPPSAAQSNTLSTELACLSVKGSFRALPAASCGASAGPGRDLYVTPTSYDGVELTLLTVAVDDPDNVVYSANRPQSGQVYDAPIDTTALDDGVHEVYLRLTNGEGAEAKGSEKLVVDSSPPTAQITYPVSGQRLCGLPPDATGVGGVEVQGSVEDLGAGSSWELETLSAAGDWHRAAGGTIPASLDPGAAIPKPLVSGRTDVGQRLDFPTGDVTVRLSALDDGGNRTCSEPVEFYLDGQVDGLEVSSERDLISPNGDGVADKTLLTYGAGEPVSLDVQVYHGVEHQVFFQTVVDPVGEPLRTLASGLAVAGAGTLSWDGRADDGSPVADGVYAVVFRATDGCGNTLQVSRGVGVDTTPPQVEILSPTAGAGLPLVVDVTGTATDEHFLDFQLDHGIGTTPFTWDVVARSGSQARASRLGLWNTYGLQGPQTLRLTARDRVGNSAAYLVTVDLPVEDSVITDLEATPDPVSPNGDGRRETTAIRFGFAQEVTATLAITSLDGTTTLRTLTSGETFPEGSASRPWDGRDEAGQPVADGEYRVRLEAAPTFDPSKVQTETLPITVDRAPPQIVVTRPRDGFASGQGTAQGTVDDPHLAQWVVELTDTPDQPDWREIARGETAVTGGDLGSLDGLAEGRYALRVTAEDTAENRAERIVPFEVDDTPPEVTLDAPAAGSVLGSAAGPVEVRGSAVEDHPASWRLELGAGDAPTAWTALASGDGLPPATLLSWQVGAVPDGLYTLRLTVEDLGGLTGEASAAVVVDDTPPTVAITAPPAGGYVTGPTAITGTAADANLLVYTLEVAPAGTDQWSELGRAASPVTSGTLLSWQALPPDGAYRLRLRAQDRAGNAAAAEVPVTVDTHSPAPPQGLAASLEGETDARLTWQASSESDLAGYRVYRGGVLLTPQPIAALTYLDPAIPEGELPYTVTAVDRAGLESAPSEPAVLTYDRTPPTVLILDPHAGSSVSGLVEVRITATSSDFKEYRLSVGAGDGSGGRQLLRSSPTPVRSEVATEWSTLGLPEGATYTLHLEAEDVRGNVGVAEAAVVIDNQPPATPTGLAASVSGSDVSLTWNANAEPDLAGYLLYRDGRLIHGSGDDLVRRALTTTSYTDPSLPDGTFTYRLAAIDKAGNVSPLSAPATATLDLHPPHVEIVQPDVGTRFDSPLYVLATTPDQDVAEVRFEMRPAGGASWSEIATGTAAPWETTWDPAGLDYGDYEIRAVARDAGGRVDPAPTPVAVTYTDLGRPARVTGLTARVDGGDVHLTWDANTEPDLAGYYVDRTAGDGSSLRVTSTPVPGTSFTDTGLADGTYSYRVAAVDVYDNEADPSEAREARVYTPELDRPLSPTRATSVDLSGSVPASQTVTVEVSRPSGTETLPPPSVAADGRFSVAGIAVERGENQISVVAADGAGNRSKPAAARVISGVPPSAPTGLTAPVTDKQVELGWSLNPEPDVVGYREVVDGNPRFYDQFTRPTSATASSYYDDYSTPSRAVDYSTYTWWSPDPTQPVDGQWVAATWPTPQLLAAVRLNWYDSASRAVDYDVQVWDGTAWVTHTRVRGNAEATPEIDFADAYPTTGVRIVLHAIAGSETEAQSVRLADLNADTRPLVASPPDTFTLYDGLHEISVSAVNAYGFESDPSAVVDAPVGDAQGPDPVTLAATVQGSDVSLSWTESPATDLRYYLIYRDGEQIGARFDLADRTYVDPGLANGTYRYTVVGVDQVGNHGPASNEAEATVDVALPPAPVALAVTDPGLGDALDLAWSPGAGEPAAVAFRVMRSETAGGPYSAVGETAATSYRDRGLTAGTTYYYVVAGLDAVGNAGDASGEASGTPEDRTGPVAVLHFPAPPGGTFRTRETIQDLIVGTTEAGAAVEVYRDGDLVGQTTASLEASSQSVTYDAYGVPRPSPDGGRALLDDYYSLDLVDFATGDVKPVTGLSYTNAFWMPDGDRLLGAVYDYDLDKSVLTTYRLSDSSRQTLAALDSVDVAVPSPDGAEAAVLGYDGALSGLLLVDLQSGEVSSLVDGGSYDFDPDSLAWSPDGSHLAFWHDGSTGTEIEIVEIATGAVTAVPAVPGDYGYPSWSPDGASLAFTVFDSGSTYSTQLWRYRLADGVAEPITSNEEDHFLPRWSPDGASIAYVGDSERLELLDLESGQVQVLRQIADWSGDLQWAPGGHLVLLDSGQPVRVTPAGRFEVRSVPLQVGDNTFTATATDDLGNRGAISPPIVVELATDANANLTVAADDLTVLPAVSLTGQQVTFTVTVHNTGVSGSPATDLDLVLLPPSGSPLPVASGLTVTALGPAASQTFTEPFTLPTVAGRWTLVATVDPRDRVLEADEDDNRAEITFPVLSGAAPAVFVATDQSQYGAEQDVTIEADLANAGAPFTGSLELTVEDTDGYTVEELPAIAVPDLGAGARELQQAVWNTGSVLAGDYRVVARLLAGDGSVAATGSAPFRIAGTASLAAEVATDRAIYDSGAAVQITGTVRDEAGNGVATDLVAHLTLLDAGGATVAEWTEPVADLLPGSEATVSESWSSAGAPTGSYRVHLDALHGGAVEASAETGFDLNPIDLGVSGTLSLSSLVPPVGTPLVASYQVTDGTQAALAGLPVHLILVASGDGTEIARQDSTVNLAAGATASGQATFATDDLALGDYRVVLRVDLAGADGVPVTTTLAVAGFAPVDGTPPEIRSVEPPDGAYVASADVVLRAVALDSLSPVDLVEMSLDGGAWLPAAVESAPDGRWSRAASGLADGDHALEVRATDAAGNQALAESAFTVDTVAPEVTVTGVEDGASYPDPVTPTIDVVELHPASQEVTLDGAPFTSGTEVSDQGAHELNVVAEDLAGNRTEVTVSFQIGVGEPEIAASNTATLASDADGDGVPSPGDELAYEIIVANTGGAEATSVVLTDPVPAHTEVVAGSVATTLGTVATEMPVEVDLGTLAAGASAVVTFRVSIDLPVPAGVDRVENQGLVTSAELPAVPTDDPALGGDHDPTVTMITAAPELVAEKTGALAVDADGDGVPSPGDTLEYRLVVRNIGNTSATGVALADPVPGQTALVAGSVATSQGTVTAESPVTVDLGEIAGRASAEVRFRVTIDDPIAAGVREVTNQGLVTSAELPDVVTDDPDAGGAADPTVTEVSAAPVLRVEKEAFLFGDQDGDGKASPGDVLLYRLTVANSGNTAATSAVLTDPLPEHTALEAGTVQTSRGTVTAEDPVTVELGTLPVGEDSVVSFQVRIDAEFPTDVLAVANQASVATAELAPVASDDPATPEAADPTVTPVFITPSISVADVSLDEHAGPAVFTVSLSEPSNREVDLSYATTDGSALAGLDYQPVSGTLVFAPGETETQVEVPVVDDLLDELDETFRLDLSNASGGTLADPQATATIVDDDPPPFLSVDDVTVTEGDGAGARAVFTLSLSAPSGLPVSADYATADGSAVAGADYTAVSDTATFAPGVTAATVEVPVTGDLLDEPDETFRLVLSNPGDAVLADAEGVATIVDDDPPPTLSVSDASVTEGDDPAADPGSEMVFHVALSAPSGFEVTVDWATADGTAVAGADYQAASGTLTFPAGTTEQTVSVAVTGDLLDEYDETFGLVLANAAHAVLPAAPGTGTILDDDPLPALSIDDVTVTEGDAGTVQAVLAVHLGAPSGREVRVSWTTADGTAVAGADYQAASGTLTFPAGTTEQTVSVSVAGDLLDEPDEIFAVRLESPELAVLADADGVVTIVDDDPPPDLAIGDASVTEGDSGTVDLRFPVTLSAPSGRQVQVSYATGDGTADAGTDYTPASGTLVFPPGTTALEVVVPVAGDRVDELDETVPVALSDPAWAVVADGEATGTIVDDDQATISIDDVTLDEGEAPVGETADALFIVHLATEADREITVDYATEEETATAGVDFLPVSGTLDFPAGTTERTIAVPVVGDDLLEPADETFRVELSNPTETEIADGSAVGTITDDELCPGPNLLANPGAEERPVDGELPGWTEVAGSSWQQRTADPDPAEGLAYFFAGPVDFGELAQEVSVQAYEVRIDSPPDGEDGQRFAFSGRVRTYDEVPPDTARIVVEYRDESDTLVLGAFDSGEISSPGEWREVSDVRAAPAGTRFIRVRLVATRFAGTDDDGYFDQLVLRSLRAPVLTVDDATAYEGGPGNTPAPGEAVFHVRLSCPFFRPVSVDYATADGPEGSGATAGQDYLPVSGSLDLPVGETEATVSVPILGDSVYEPRETFRLDLSDPQPADEVVRLDLVDLEGTGTILDDDFCARSHGFWKTHEEVWPTDHLELGGVDYDPTELLAILGYNGPDASYHLALQLVATKLDLLAGSDPSIVPTVDQADDLLALFPPGSNPKKGDKTMINQVKDVLDAYNNPSCQEVPVLP